MENTTFRVSKFLSGFFRRKLATDEDIFSSGVLNSLFMLQMIMFLEREFAIRIENADLDMANFRTINNIVRFIERKT
jgi:methoxymalonate biosynthesis acyl carrier protein